MKSKDLIRTYRTERNYTQIELAKKAGIAVNTLRLYEGGKRQPSMKQLRRLADALNISVTQLMDTEEDMSADDDGSYDFPRTKSISMYPTEAGNVILCIVSHDDTVSIKLDYPMVPIVEEAYWRLSKEDVDDIRLIVNTYYSKHHVDRLPPEIGAGILRTLELMTQKSQREARQRKENEAAETTE